MTTTKQHTYSHKKYKLNTRSIGVRFILNKPNFWVNILNNGRKERVKWLCVCGWFTKELLGISFFFYWGRGSLKKRYSIIIVLTFLCTCACVCARVEVFFDLVYANLCKLTKYIFVYVYIPCVRVCMLRVFIFICTFKLRIMHWAKFWHWFITNFVHESIVVICFHCESV